MKVDKVGDKAGQAPRSGGPVGGRVAHEYDAR